MKLRIVSIRFVVVVFYTIVAIEMHKKRKAIFFYAFIIFGGRSGACFGILFFFRNGMGMDRVLISLIFSSMNDNEFDTNH